MCRKVKRSKRMFDSSTMHAHACGNACKGVVHADLLFLRCRRQHCVRCQHTSSFSLCGTRTSLVLALCSWRCMCVFELAGLILSYVTACAVCHSRMTLCHTSIGTSNMKRSEFRLNPVRLQALPASVSMSVLKRCAPCR